MNSKNEYKRYTPEMYAFNTNSTCTFFETRTPSTFLYNEIHVYQNPCVIQFLEDKFNCTIEQLQSKEAIEDFIKLLEKENDIHIKQCAYFHNQKQHVIKNTYQYGHIDGLPSKHIQLSYESENAMLFGY